jgi:hypothetical protein
MPLQQTNPQSFVRKAIGFILLIVAGVICISLVIAGNAGSSLTVEIVDLHLIRGVSAGEKQKFKIRISNKSNEPATLVGSGAC